MVCSWFDDGVACALEEASPDRGERPSGEISGVTVHEGDNAACMHSIICFDILSVSVSTREDSVLAHPSPWQAVGREGVVAK